MLLPAAAEDLADFTRWLRNQDLDVTRASNALTDYLDKLRDRHNDVMSARDFGAKGDGSTDDTDAVQKAFHAVSDNGGVIEFPNTNKDYVCDGKLKLRSKRNVILRGHFGSTPTRDNAGFVSGLRYTGTGGPFIDYTDSYIHFEHMRTVYDSLTEVLVGGNNSPTRSCRFTATDSTFGGHNPGNHRTADTIIDLGFSQSSALRNCWIDGGVNGIRGITTPHPQATVTLTVAAQPTAGDTMTIDRKLYTFDTNGGLTNVNGHIEIGADLATTQTNIVNAINLTGTPGTGYAASMTIHPSVSAAAFSSNASTLTAIIGGKPGADYASTETFTSGSNVFSATTFNLASPEVDYANGVLLHGVFFKNLTGYGVLNPDLAWSLVGCWFEPNPTTEAPNAVMCEAQTYAEALLIAGNWVGDIDPDTSGNAAYTLRGLGITLIANHARTFQYHWLEAAEALRGVVAIGNSIVTKTNGKAFDFDTDSRAAQSEGWMEFANTVHGDGFNGNAYVGGTIPQRSFYGAHSTTTYGAPTFGQLNLPVFTDTTRPSPADVGTGSVIWNSDDNAPNYSDGTDWRTAAGAVT